MTTPRFPFWCLALATFVTACSAPSSDGSDEASEDVSEDPGAITSSVNDIDYVGRRDASRERHITPGQDMRAALEALRPGDTLLVDPGTYAIGGISPQLAKGLASNRIVVRGTDPLHPPLLQGYLVLHDADYWTLSGLRLQATVPTKSALFMSGGIHWVVANSEIFGASSTGSFANVAIANSTAPPNGWLFTQNCVHDAGHGTVAGHNDTDHNVYIMATGSAPGVLSRNILFNAINGSNVKVGNGGDRVAPGASNVKLEYNTTYNANHQFLIFGTVTGVALKGNLMIRSIGRTPVGIYFNDLSQAHAATAAHDYGYLMDHNVWAPNSARATYAEGDNPLYNDAAHDPRIAAGCGGFHPRNATAARYGRHTTVAY